MKFAHLADCHIGGWREDNIKELTIQTFEKAVEICIEENVNFILISGDLFDNPMPSIDILKRTTTELKKLKDNNISVYIIHGSHDYSVSGKTILDVFEKAGLLENVCKLNNNNLRFTEDKSGAKITGLIGKRNSLEVEDFKNLNMIDIEDEKGFKIFMFHTGIEEFKPQNLKEIKSTSLELFPKNFNYYAGGHIHYIFNTSFSNGLLAYPGPLYPSNTKELEHLKYGGFYICETDENNIKLNYKQIKIKEVLLYNFRVDNKTSEEIVNLILENLSNVEDKIVILKIEGKMKGQPSQIDFSKIYENFSKTYSILKITTNLEGDQFKELDINIENEKDIESLIINEYKDIDNELMKQLIRVLDKEKDEGERVSDFESAIIKEATKTLELE